MTPNTKNFNKRLVKMPKLYFYDTGLLCNLLRILSKVMELKLFRGTKCTTKIKFQRRAYISPLR
ncbi:MAG: DUF4143 domain-containing protein [Prolixibacteraceae bacterium]